MYYIYISPEFFWLHVSYGHRTLWDVIDPICLMDHRGLDHGICLLPTMPWPCWDSATPPLYLHLPDGSWRSGLWNMPPTSYSYTVIFIECVLTLNLSFCTHYIYCTSPSWRDPPLLLSWRFLPFVPPEGLFGSFSWSDVRFWGRDVYVYRL